MVRIVLDNIRLNDLTEGICHELKDILLSDRKEDVRNLLEEIKGKKVEEEDIKLLKIIFSNELRNILIYHQEKQYKSIYSSSFNEIHSAPMKNFPLKKLMSK